VKICEFTRIYVNSREFTRKSVNLAALYIFLTLFLFSKTDSSQKLMQALLTREEAEIAKLNLGGTKSADGRNPNKPCFPNDPKQPCQSNEFCLLNGVSRAYECICPNNMNFYRVGEQHECREYLPNMSGCMLNLHQCVATLNEACLSLNPMSKHGTCQCARGFLRNVATKQCEPNNGGFVNERSGTGQVIEVLKNEVPFMTANSRRRPSPPPFSPDSADKNGLDGHKQQQQQQQQQQQDVTDDELVQEIINELVSGSPSSVNSEASVVLPGSKVVGDKIVNLGRNVKETRPVVVVTTTEATTTTTTTTEVPSIYTKDLIANAGYDAHVW
jgi:hypothetical protein